MSQSPQPLKRVVVLIAAVALGYAAGHWLRFGKATSDPPEESPGQLVSRGGALPVASQLDAKLDLLERDEFPDLIQRLHELPTTRARIAIELVVREWAQRDAPAALVYFSQAEPTPHRWTIGFALFSAWAELDGETALSEGSRIFAEGFDEGETDWRESAIIGWAKSDPQRAWLAARESYQRRMSNALIHSVFSSWALSDKQVGLETVMVLQSDRTFDTYLRDLAMRTFLGTILPIDGELVLQQVESETVDFPEDALDRWMRTDSVAAITFVRETPESHPAKKKIIDAWFRVDPRAAIEFLRQPENTGLRESMRYRLGSFHEYLSDDELVELGGAVANGVPLHRLQEIAGKSPELLQQADSPLVSAMVDAFAAEDPEAGLAWLQELPEAQREEAYSDLLFSWSLEDVEAATEYLLGVPGGREHFTVLASLHMYSIGVGRSWEDDEEQLAKIVPKVEAWLTAMSPEERAEFFALEYGTIAERFPELAKTWILDLPEGKQRREAALQVMHTLEQESRGSIHEWFPQLPPDVQLAAFLPKGADPDEIPETQAEPERSFLDEYRTVEAFDQFRLALQLPEHQIRTAAVLGALSAVPNHGGIEYLSYEQRREVTELVGVSDLPQEEKALVQERVDGAP